MLTMTMRRKERHQFRAIFVLTYPIFLAGAVVQRLTPGRDAEFGVRERPHKSIFHEAKVLADRTIPFAFKG